MSFKRFLSYFSNRISGSKPKETTNNISYSKVDDLLQSLVNTAKVPGIAITVTKHDKTTFKKGYGFSNLETKTPINPDASIFRIASVSKPIAATALALMVEDGLLQLDESFYTYVPYYPKKQYDFTIRQLACHTAGIRGYRGKEYGLNTPYTIKDSIAIFKDDDLLFKPGTSYHYNSYDWVLLSLAMQEVSGIPFEAYVQKRVLDPLQMQNTQADVKGKVISNITEFYSQKRQGFRKAMEVNNYYKLAGGGFLSTTADIVKLGNAYLKGNLLEQNTQQVLLTAQEVKGESTYYGLGWQVSTDKKGNAYYGHIGNGVGGYSNFFVYPKQGLVISILTNCTNPNIQDVLDEVILEFVEKTKVSIQ
ncbi:beta-lactamase family protein [Cellulophaga sp. 20_2_10]|uniref:serine hydrolase domain-containing protein n=1 Tax=Cellulophaga sp. 20_2_10 TaxID=2942476 RepID=UPI00201A2E55|nr:serine hydrolase domain-containing protein [Cellulophaga sp. 20_2_10]MCL5245845.1 beta-lactamase family protein [Cellulophaga sp. 20_2_10]